MNKMITIPRAEYDRLRALAEDYDAITAYDRAMAMLASGTDAAVPADIAKRLIGGENPLRVWRACRGMTQAQLATASGVNRVQISDMETGKAGASVATLARLARALAVDMDDLADAVLEQEQ